MELRKDSASDNKLIEENKIKENTANEVVFSKTQNRTKEENNVKRVDTFKILALPTLIYAIVSTFILYDNFESILMPLFSVATIIYTKIVLNKFNIEMKKGWKLFAGAIILLGISDMLTDNVVMIFYNNVMIFILIILMLLYVTYEQKSWSISKHISSFFMAMFDGVAGFAEFFGDSCAAVKESKNQKTKTGLYCIIGVAAFIPLAIILVPLLSSADAVFGKFVDDVFGKIFSLTFLIYIPLFFACIYLFAYGGMKSLKLKNIKETEKLKNRWPGMVANTVLCLVNVIYVLFSGIQIFSLFLGKMKLPEGYTYANYAREGFNQLLFVCFINLVLVLMAKSKFEVSKVTKVLLSIFSACTYIMIISATVRLILYIKVYNLTVLRLEVIVSLLVITILISLTLVSIYVERLNLIYAIEITVVSVFLLFSLLRPEFLVAGYNLSHVNENTDYSYISELSADVAPFMSEVDNIYADKYFHDLEEHNKEYSWRQTNISRLIASFYMK